MNLKTLKLHIDVNYSRDDCLVSWSKQLAKISGLLKLEVEIHSCWNTSTERSFELLELLRSQMMIGGAAGSEASARRELDRSFFSKTFMSASSSGKRREMMRHVSGTVSESGEYTQ